MLKPSLTVLLFIIFINMTFSAVTFAKTTSSTRQGDLNYILQNQSFKKVGDTMFSILFWDLYQSKLLTTSGDYPINESDDKLIYEIKYLKSISSEDLIVRTVEQWEHLGLNLDVYEAYLPQLNKLWPDINAGDSLSMLMDKSGTTFYYNNVYVGEIEGTEFGPIFLDIWLAENTSQPKLRNELLGKVNE